MILWFNDGTYVMKALDLKQRMGVLTGEEKEKYEQRFIPKLIPPEKAPGDQGEQGSIRRV